jgi:hypothetical protein
MVAVVALLFQVYDIEPVPPVALVVIDPLVCPKQPIFETLMLAEIADGWLKNTDATDVQLLASVTVTLYVPDVSPDKEDDVALVFQIYE